MVYNLVEECSTKLKHCFSHFSTFLQLLRVFRDEWWKERVSEKIDKEKRQNVRQFTKETWMWSLLSAPGAERRITKMIKFSPLIPYRNIWRLVKKNCICIVWLNGLISNNWILFMSELVWLASYDSTFNITDQISHFLIMLYSMPRPLWLNYPASDETARKRYPTPTLTVVQPCEVKKTAK